MPLTAGNRPGSCEILIPAAGALPAEVPVAWTDGGRSPLVRTPGETPARVYRLDLAPGRRDLWKELIPSDPSGAPDILGVVTTPGERFYACSRLRLVTELHLVEGLR